MTETTNLFPDSAEPLSTNDGVMFDVAGTSVVRLCLVRPQPTLPPT